MATISAMPPAEAGDPSGSGGLYKLVKLGHDGAVHAPTDVEVARIEASFMDLDAEKELLRSEEEERQELLERMQTYDLMLSRIETQQQQKKISRVASSERMTSSGEAKLTIDFDAQGVSQAKRALPSLPPSTTLETRKIFLNLFLPTSLRSPAVFFVTRIAPAFFR
jgi:hypothetical protein